MEDSKNLCKAMAEAFREIEGAVKDKANPFFRSKYADLGNVVDAIKPALTNHGLWFLQKVHPTPGFASVETIIVHESGETMSCGVTSVPVGKWDPKTGQMVGCDAQAMGAGITYARRFGLSSAFGVAPMDDDGNSVTLKDRKEDRKVDKEFASQEVRKLDSQELKKLASKVANILMDDHTLNCAISDLEMEEYLAFWQTKTALQPMIDSLLISDKERILNGFMKWQAKQAA